MTDYFRQRGFSDATVAKCGWRVEELNGRATVYGFPPEAASATACFIPYLHRNGRIAFERIRLIHEHDLERFGGGKYRQPGGRKLSLYDPFGILASDGPLDSIVLIEGEFNAVALREMVPELPVIGLPGQAALKEALAEGLGHVPVVFLWMDREDRGFERNVSATVEKLRQAGVEEVRLIEDTAGMDANETLITLGAEKGGGLVIELLDHARVYTPPEQRATAQHPPQLAHEPRILDRFRRDVVRCGLVGEDGAAQIIYLAGTSRLLEKPVSVVVKGPSAGGKSFVVETGTKFLPPSAFYEMTGMSERAFAYSDEPLKHRVLVVYEAAGLTGEWASYLVRSLLSEGRVRYETVEKTKEGMKARMIEREGPTSLIVTTTQIRLHPENETRLLTIPVTDSAEQTKAVMLALAEGQAELPDMSEWIALQDWIAARECRVWVPYARRLAEEIPPAAVRLRRDFSALLGLISAHALLHQATRESDDQGRIIATVEDYAVVRGLVNKLVSDAIGATVRPETRETVSAVKELAGTHADGVPQAALVKKLTLDRSTVSRRVRVALDGGYLRNLEDRKGRPARLVIGDPLPEDIDILPMPEALEDCCTVARLSGGIKREAA